MKLPVHIQFHGLARSDALALNARERAYKLESFAPDIMSCHVGIDRMPHDHSQEVTYGVRIDLTRPGVELVVNRVPNADVHVALREAFDNMKSQLLNAERRHLLPLVAQDGLPERRAGNRRPQAPW